MTNHMEARIAVIGLGDVGWPLAVRREFDEFATECIRALDPDPHVLHDLKYLLPRGAADLRL